MNILITGGTGLIGSKLREHLSNDHNVFATRYENPKAEGCSIFLDVTNQRRVEFILNQSIEFTENYPLDAIIHTAAMTNVDACERYSDYEKDSVTNRAYQRNFYATKYLLDAMNKGCKFIYISSNYVFDGKNGPYSEEDVAENPVNYYGESKLAAERYVLASNKEALVVRISSPFIYSEKNCFPKFVLENISMFKEIMVTGDMFTTPSYIDDICRGIKLLMDKNAQGIYHISGNRNLSMFDFAKIIAIEFGFGEELIKCRTIDQIFPNVKRPENAGLRSDKLMNKGFEGTPLESAVKMFVYDYRKAFKQDISYPKL